MPALSIDSGTDYLGRPVGWGLAQRQAYVNQRYHKPADVYEATWDLTGTRQQLELLYEPAVNSQTATFGLLGTTTVHSVPLAKHSIRQRIDCTSATGEGVELVRLLHSRRS